jgi:hypothetical protein
VRLDRKAFRALKEFKALKVQQEIRDLQDRQVLKVFKA